VQAGVSQQSPLTFVRQRHVRLPILDIHLLLRGIRIGFHLDFLFTYRERLLRLNRDERRRRAPRRYVDIRGRGDRA
jgi:hypothetical protein